MFGHSTYLYTGNGIFVLIKIYTLNSVHLSCNASVHTPFIGLRACGFLSKTEVIDSVLKGKVCTVLAHHRGATDVVHGHRVYCQATV